MEITVTDDVLSEPQKVALRLAWRVLYNVADYYGMGVSDLRQPKTGDAVLADAVRLALYVVWKDVCWPGEDWTEHVPFAILAPLFGCEAALARRTVAVFAARVLADEALQRDIRIVRGMIDAGGGVWT